MLRRNLPLGTYLKNVFNYVYEQFMSFILGNLIQIYLDFFLGGGGRYF